MRHPGLMYSVVLSASVAEGPGLVRAMRNVAMGLRQWSAGGPLPKLTLKVAGSTFSMQLLLRICSF